MKYTYTIYQTVDNSRAFNSYRQLIERFGSVNMKPYKRVATGEIESDTELEACEALYKLYNSNPEGFEGHSMSVSDVVAIRTLSGLSLYYCDIVGFKKFHRRDELPMVTLDTYPELIREDGTENENYDNELRVFSVPLSWVVSRIKDRGYDSMAEFLDNFTWDDTFHIYEEAVVAGALISESIEVW